MSKSISISLSNSARAIVRLHTDGEKIVYSAYISDHGVTLDTVSDHVASLRDLAVTMNRIDAADKVALKRFSDKVRNGLNTHLGKVVPSKADSTALLTSLGKAATKEDVLAAWEAAQTA